jgi:hypothetical protein
MPFPSPSRLRAFLWHLSISATIGLLALILVFQVWYPAPLHKMVGVTDIFLLLLSVDVILGPCLTFTVARPGKAKKLLLIDLSCIIAAQGAALVYGLHTVAAGRPAWLVLNVDRVDLVRVVDVDERQLDKALPEYRRVPWSGPRWVFAPLPTDLEERNSLTLEEARGGPRLYHRPEYYRPLAEGIEILREKAEPLSTLEKFNPKEAVQAQLAKYPEADAWTPFIGNLQSTVVLWKKAETRVVAVVELNPLP